MEEPTETQEEEEVAYTCNARGIIKCIKCGEPEQGDNTLSRCFKKGRDWLLSYANERNDTLFKSRILAAFNSQDLWLDAKCRKSMFNEHKLIITGKQGSSSLRHQPQMRTRSASSASTASLCSTTSAGSSTSMGSTSSASCTHRFDYRTCCIYCGVQICEWVDEKGERVVRPLRMWKKNISFVESKEWFDRSIRRKVEGRTDDWACQIRGRVESVLDLRAEDACYMRTCAQLFSMGRKRPGARAESSSKTKKPRGFYAAPVGRSGKPGLSKVYNEQGEAFIKVLEYIEEGEEDRYWTCEELQEKMREYTDDVYGARHFLNKLEAEYGTSIKVLRAVNQYQFSLIYMNQTADSILQKYHKEKRLGDTGEEKKRIIKLAAELIKSDIMDIVPDKTEYFAFSDLNLNNAVAMVPASLLQLLQCISPWRSMNKDLPLVHATLGQAMIQLARPNTMIAPLQLALATELHHKTGSKFVVDMLHKMGLCKQYAQVTQFARDLIFHDISGYNKVGELPLYAADNADVNNRTIDGKNTLHMMGMIECVLGDKSATVLDMKKIKKIGASDAAIRAKAVPIRYIDKLDKTKLKVTLRGLGTFKSSAGIFRGVINLDFLRIAAKLTKPVPEFSGHMKLITKQNDHPGSFNVHFLPFVNMDPTDSSTIYSTMFFISETCVKQKTKCVITFDQPLWWKAMMIKKQYSELNNITLLLGNFHNSMAFHACIGFIMKNTGLKELLSTVYGELSVEAILKGKAYERAVRCHDLLTTVLKAIVLKQVPEEDKYSLEAAVELYESYKEDDSPTNIFRDNPIISALVEVFNSVREKLTGNRKNFTKSLYWFLQEMEDIDPEVREAFDGGLFVARLTDTHWAGIFPDRVIESTLMAGLKGSTGLTRGRGLTEMTQLIWALSRPAIVKLDLKMKELTGCRHTTSNQQEIKQIRASAISRNTEDMKKFEEFCSKRFILNVDAMSTTNTQLRNIASGLIAPSNVSVHKAEEVGNKILEGMKGGNPLTIILRNADRTVQMPVKLSASATTAAMTSIDSELIFQRFVATCTEEDVEEAFTFELSHFPPALFTDNGSFRTVHKADLGNALKETVVCGAMPDKVKMVIDGGLLLYTVPWVQGKTYGEIVDGYINYVKKHFPRPGETYIIFDGYLQSSTKDMTHKLRCPVPSLEINISRDTAVDCKMELLLSNTKNKHQFIGLLMAALEVELYHVRQCTADADTEVVRQAMELCDHSHVCVVAEDTDVLIMMLHHIRSPKHCIYLKTEKMVVDIGSLGNILPAVTLDTLLLTHAMSGCDTTSGFFGFGKTRLFKSKMVASTAAEFYCRQEGTYRIVNAGINIIIQMYTKPTGAPLPPLDKLRYKLFLDALHRKKGAVQRKVDHRRLPPTSSAAKYHVLRVYHQVQEWLFNTLDPLEYGWTLNSDRRYEPVYTDKEVAPPNLLRSVSCGCKTNCSSKRCGCKQLDFQCTDFCKCGDNCENQDSVRDQEEDEANIEEE